MRPPLTHGFGPSPPGARRAARSTMALVVAMAARVSAAQPPPDPARDAPFPWTRFLAEAFPEGIDPGRSREPHTIREPGPDTANYPNSPFTLPRGGVYVETSPVFWTSAINTIQPATYNAELLVRLGLTDRVEFRVFSGGFSWQAAGLGQGATTGFSPLTFDTKIHFWEENRDWFLPAAGFEAFVQTPWGSPAFDAGTQPGMMMLFSNTLWWGVTAEWNVGLAADSTVGGGFVPIDIAQWAFTKSITESFDLFVHGFQNESALPRLSAQTVVGAGFIWYPSDRLSVFGNWGAGTDRSGPATTFQLGCAGSF